MSMDGYRISLRNYVSTRIKMVSSDSWPSWVAYTTMNFGLAFHFQGKIQGQGTGYRISSRNYVSTRTNRPQTMAILPGQHTQPGPLNWRLTRKVKFKVNEWGTGYRPKITTAREPKWSQTTAILSRQLTHP